MTREEAITIIDSLHLIGCGRYQHENDLKINVALDMAIEALHREEAEEKGYCHRIIPSNVEVVVRCKDCRWWNSGTKGCKRNPSVEAWYETDFCKYGEREESEVEE